MFVRKNLLQQAHMLRRNNLLKGLALFFLGASAVLLFSSADLVLNPYISNSFVYLQKMFLTPSGTSNTATTISFDGTSGSIVASGITTNLLTTTNLSTSVLTASVATVSNGVNTSQICSVTGANCFNPANVSGDVSSLAGRLAQLEALVQSLSGKVASYHP